MGQQPGKDKDRRAKTDVLTTESSRQQYRQKSQIHPFHFANVLKHFLHTNPEQHYQEHRHFLFTSSSDRGIATRDQLSLHEIASDELTSCRRDCAVFGKTRVFLRPPRRRPAQFHRHQVIISCDIKCALHVEKWWRGWQLRHFINKPKLSEVTSSHKVRPCRKHAVEWV